MPSRRETVNRNGIDRIKGFSSNEIWIQFTCVNCGQINALPIGDKLVSPNDAYESFSWFCSKCGYKHSKDSDLPDSLSNWDSHLRSHGDSACQGFWRKFFSCSTEKPQVYLKRCKTCGRVLPYSCFDRHAKWSVLEKQLECRACKGAINAIGNGKRTKDQLHESSVRRRIGDLLAKKVSKINEKALFERFGGKCFKTGKVLDINNRGEWAIDHILPSKYLYPLTEDNAALLCKEANENKRDRWPSEFYNNDELKRLSDLTGANLELLSSPDPIINSDIDPDNAVEKYLKVRTTSSLTKRIKEIKKILEEYGLVDRLSDVNKKKLGYF